MLRMQLKVYEPSPLAILMQQIDHKILILQQLEIVQMFLIRVRLHVSCLSFLNYLYILFLQCV